MIPRFDNGHTRRHRPDLRQRRLSGRPEEGARSRQVHGPAARAGRRAQAGPATSASASASYVEICGLGPSQVAGAIGFQGGLWESAIVRVHPTGKVHVFIGASPHGQGEETTFAQLVASEIGVGVDDVKVVHGDTDTTPMGWGTYGSRTTAVGGAALILATRKVKEKAKLIAAHLLEAAVEDMDYADGKFFVKGSPDKAKTIQDIALMANVAWNMPTGVESGLEASMFYDPPNFTYPFGSHLAVVEVDRGDGTRSTSSATSRSTTAVRRSTRSSSKARCTAASCRASARRCGKKRSTTTTGQLRHRLDARLRAAARRYAVRHRSAVDRDAVAASSARPQGRRRGRHDRVDRRGLQRRDRRARAARRRDAEDADDRRARVARDATAGSASRQQLQQT